MKVILCAIDFSPASANIIKVAKDMAIQKEINLVVLYAYRLIQPDSEEIQEYRNSKEKQAVADFETLAKKVNLNGEVHYEFRPEIGFLSDRIDSYLKKNPVETIVMSQSLAYSLNESKEKAVDHFLNDRKIPVLVVP